ncbi:MAG: GntR family transcriptional regulator [bacterium]|nr:GntR family transcriptional regulator [bacterium]
MEHVYDRTKEMILTGELRPGERLIVDSLAQKLQVSRTPVREALRQLVADGFVRLLPRKRVTVTELSIGDIHNLYAVRRPLEMLACELAVANLTRSKLAPIVECHHSVLKAVHRGDPAVLKEVRKLNRAFHLGIYRLTGNPYLEDLLPRLRDRSNCYIEPMIHWEGLDKALDGHTAILEALTAGDVDGMKKAIQRDMERTVELAVQLLRQISDVVRQQTEGGNGA